MGVVEDNEPPLKRVKLPVGEVRTFLDHSSVTGPVSCSLGDLMARPLNSQGDGETVGSRGVIKRLEFVKIITRALYLLPYIL
ncbi:hypothetical protein RCOM_1454380 [Ricinus communis]|uniref:Uncharacterized protein n=1 Tax=Ricinus communis TaxID=3988 RepID=B9RGJ5_RICCO|nr:hypothetical protein RCOM_1454380 [Ricinus communis]